MNKNKDFNIVINRFADAIKTRIDIAEHICRFEDLKKVSTGWMGAHSTHASESSGANHFSINTAENYYKCFSCEEGGDVITYEQNRLGCTPLEAMRSLAQEYGIDIPDLSQYHEMTPQEKEEFDKQTEQYKRIEALQKDYLRLTVACLSDEHHKYLKDRGLTDKSIKEFQLGYAAQRIKQEIVSLGYTDDELTASGLFTEAGYQVLIDRITIPTMDKQNKPCHFLGRSMETKSDTVKYLSQRSNRGQNVQAVYRAVWQYGTLYDKLDDDKTYKPVLIVEGSIDGLLAAQEFKNKYVIMSSNTHTLSVDQIKQLANELISIGKRTIIICNDNEVNKAGHNGAVSTIERLQKAIREAFIDTEADMTLQKEQEEEANWVMPECKIVTLRKPPELQKIDLADFITQGAKEEALYWIDAAITLDEYHQRLIDNPIRFYSRGPRGGKGKLIHKKVVDEILTDGHYFVCGGDELYWYTDGVYTICKQEIEVLIKNKLGIDATAESITKVYNLLEMSVKDPRIKIDYGDTEKDKTWVNTLSGWLDFSAPPCSHDPIPHTPYRVSFAQIKAKYDKNAQCPIYDKFIVDVLTDDDIPEWYKMLGYVMVRTLKYQKAFMLTGSGGNGKSTAIEALQALIGLDNYWVASLADLEGDKFASADLLGKLANFHTDLPPGYVPSEGKFKQIVTGEPIKGEHKYGHPFIFKPECTLVFSANEIPRTNDNTYAYHRRWKYFAFNRQFSETDEEDTDLLNKLITPEELSGVLVLSWIGYEKLEREGGFKDTEESLRVAQEFKQINDIVTAFITDAINYTELEDDLIYKQDLYTTFKDYVSSHGTGRENVSAIRFNKRIKEILPGVIDGEDHSNNNRRCWKGVRISSAFDIEMGSEADL